MHHLRMNRYDLFLKHLDSAGQKTKNFRTICFLSTVIHRIFASLANLSLLATASFRTISVLPGFDRGSVLTTLLRSFPSRDLPPMNIVFLANLRFCQTPVSREEEEANNENELAPLHGHLTTVLCHRVWGEKNNQLQTMMQIGWSEEAHDFQNPEWCRTATC